MTCHLPLGFGSVGWTEPCIISVPQAPKCFLPDSVLTILFTEACVGLIFPVFYKELEPLSWKWYGLWVGTHLLQQGAEKTVFVFSIGPHL